MAYNMTLILIRWLFLCVLRTSTKAELRAEKAWCGNNHKKISSIKITVKCFVSIWNSEQGSVFIVCTVTGLVEGIWIFNAEFLWDSQGFYDFLVQFYSDDIKKFDEILSFWT